LKAESMIQLCLTDDVMYNVMDEETAAGLWSKLETLSMKRASPTQEITVWVAHDRRDSGVRAPKLFQQGHQLAFSCQQGGQGISTSYFASRII